MVKCRFKLAEQAPARLHSFAVSFAKEREQRGRLTHIFKAERLGHIEMFTLSHLCAASVARPGGENGAAFIGL